MRLDRNDDAITALDAVLRSRLHRVACKWWTRAIGRR
jgi:hypothetical protein